MAARWTSCAGVAALASALVAAGCGGSDNGSSGSSSGDTITFALTPAATSACLKVTDERGVFKQNGITMKFVSAPPTSAAQIAQILNGQVTAGLGSTTGVIAAVAQGLPVMITNAQERDYDRDGATALAAIARKGVAIGSFNELEGKTVAVNSLQGSWEVNLREAVSVSGGDPEKVKLLAVPFPDQAAALRSGRVDATYTLQPFIAQLTADGYKSIGDPLATSFGTPRATTSVTFMAKQWVEAHPDVVKRFVAAVEKGNAWCNAHPSEMRNAIAEITKVPRAIIDQAPVPDYSAAVHADETRKWADLMVKYGVIEDAPPLDQLQWNGAPR